MGEGLIFKKIDLHTHTPGSKCFKNKIITPGEFVDAAINKNLSAIAITDHNTGKWIDEIKDAALSKDLTVFPGVEITVSPGIHIIAILDENKGTEDIQNLLGTLKVPTEEQGESDAICKLGAEEVIDIIKQKGGLAVLAHIDGIKGAYTTFTGSPQRRLFNESRYDAVETSSGDLPAGYTKENGFVRMPCCYQASDNPDPKEPIKHSIKGLGTHCSYFKLGGKITLEGLRQCFIDSKVRIKKMEYVQEPLYPKILSLKASEGFLKYQNIKFHRGLNSIIGGKGVGKSLIVELIRFAFDQNSRNIDILRDHESKLEKRLGVQNFVEVVFQNDSGTTYMIKRTLKGEYTCKNLTNDEVYNGNIKDLFPILAYSQMEVIKTAEDETAQLILIDGFTDLHEENRMIRMLQQNLIDNDILLGESNKSYYTLQSLDKDFNTLKEQINEIDKTMGGNEAENNTLNEYKTCEAKNTFLQSQIKYIENLKNIVGETYTKILNTQSSETNADDKNDALICGIQEKIVSGHSKLLEELKNSENEIIVTYDLVNSKINEWQLIFKSKEEEYNKLVKESDGKKILATKRKTLIANRDSVLKQIGIQNLSCAQYEDLLTKRKNLLIDLNSFYENKYLKRKEVFDLLTQKSNRRLQLTIEYAMNTQLFKEGLGNLLKGSGVRSADVECISQRISPQEFSELVISKSAVEISSKADITEASAEKIIDKLWSEETTEKVWRLQHSYYPDDVPTIKYLKDDGIYAPLNELSIGQKCTALLIIALSGGTCPVLIDQPEDALDVTTVWQDISMNLRKSKDRRQFILTTHNASVAVASDSDMFIIVKSNSQQANVKCWGAIEVPDVKKAVIQHLEGGNEPYNLRLKKYNIESS